MKRSEKKAIRDYLLSRDGAEAIRIRMDESVFVHGPIPNTDKVGWYFAGWTRDLLTQISETQSA